MQIQKIEFPGSGEADLEKLYLHGAGSGLRALETGGIHISYPGFIRFDTYFNAVSIEKWKYYTELKQLAFCFEAEGSFLLEIWNAWEKDDGAMEKMCLVSLAAAEGQRSLRRMEIPIERCERGILYAEFKTVEESDAFFYSGEYATEQNPEQEIALAVAICTYKRERYLYRNLDLIYQKLWENRDSVLYHKLHTIVADNGRSIAPEKTWEGLCVYPNKNAGGAAGFTRGILEAKRHGKFTHILLMDDDVQIQPSALERTYVFLSLLKPAYRGAMLGGAMLRLDYGFVQQESGGCYRAGRITSLHTWVDLREPEAVIKNEAFDKADYNAWWYCCIPMHVIEKAGLPLPLFLHNDDVEYGLRCGTEIIRMNGICVWHAAFENKRPSANEYYDVRNALIVNALYGQDESGSSAVRMIVRRMLTNLFRYRYRDIRLIVRAVRDFLRGPEWLMGQDAEQLHQEIVAAGYRYCEEYEGQWEERNKEVLAGLLAGRSNSSQIERRKLLSLNGWLLPARKDDAPTPVMAGDSPHACYRRRRVFIYDPDTGLGFYTGKEIRELFSLVGTVFRIYMELKKHYKPVVKAYCAHRKELGSEAFWSRYLELGGRQNENKL